jgi:hypothetical protein
MVHHGQCTLNLAKDYNCHSGYLCPLALLFLKSQGKSVKTSHTFKSLYLLLRVLNCFIFFLCRYEKDMVLPLVIFALWERSWNNILDANRLQMAWALWKSLFRYWFSLGMKAGPGRMQTLCYRIPGERLETSEKQKVPGHLATCSPARHASTPCQPLKCFQFILDTLALIFRWHVWKEEWNNYLVP